METGATGEPSEAPPDERGGNRYVRPKATRATLRLYHEERFPPTRLSAGCGFRKETIAGMPRNGRDAPKAVIRPVAIEPPGSTHSGRSCAPRGLGLAVVG